MPRILTSPAPFLLLAIAVVANADAQTQSAARAAQSPPPEFWAARNEREQARATRNAAVFARLTTDDFIVIDPAGQFADKKDRLERMARAGGPGPFVATERLNERVAMYKGDTVILQWQQKAPDGLQNVTEVWLLDGGQWKCAAAHGSPAPR
jgi:hypothetical protein